MADYARTAANVLASVYARRFIPSPAYVIRGDVPVPNVLIAGENIDAGETVMQAADDKIYLADANNDPLCKVIGIAENKALTGQPISVVVSDPEFQHGLTGVAIGDIPIVSATPGGICSSADMAATWRVSPLGVAWSTTKMNLNITRSDVARA
jgi:hypothetical protein